MDAHCFECRVRRARGASHDHVRHARCSPNAVVARVDDVRVHVIGLADLITNKRAAGLSPAAMAEFFRRVTAWRADHPAHGEAPALLSSHPPDAERIARFEQTAAAAAR